MSDKFEQVEEYAVWVENLLEQDLVSYRRSATSDFLSTSIGGEKEGLDDTALARRIDINYVPNNLNSPVFWKDLRILSEGDGIDIDLSRYIKA